MRIAITVSKELDAPDGAHRFVLLPIPRREFDASIALRCSTGYARSCKCRNNAVPYFARLAKTIARTIGARALTMQVPRITEIRYLDEQMHKLSKFCPL